MRLASAKIYAPQTTLLQFIWFFLDKLTRDENTKYNKVQRYIGQPNLARVVTQLYLINKIQYKCELENIYSEESQQDLSSVQMKVRLTFNNVFHLHLIG